MPSPFVRLLLFLIVLVAPGCVDPPDDDGASPTTAVAAAEGKGGEFEIVVCGRVCPAGYHSISYQYSGQCGTTIEDNQVTCERTVGDSFGTCDAICPAGYHSYLRTTWTPCGNQFYNRRLCEPNRGLRFDSCDRCPPGYAQVSTQFDTACGGGSTLPNEYTCERQAAGALTLVGALALPAGATSSIELGWSTRAVTSASVVAYAPGQAARVLSTAPSGSVSYGPVRPGEQHRFELYGDGIFLDSRVLDVALMSATITASPQNVVVTGAAGTTTVTWSTANVGAAAQVYVRVDGGAPSLFASGAAGSAVASWISPGRSYTFTVHPGDANAPTLASVVVTGQAAAVVAPAGGAWWNPNRSGNGLDLRVAGDAVNFAWFTYDLAGSPTWYLATLARGAGQWVGDLNRYTWTGTTAMPSVVGRVTLTLTSSTRGTLAYTVDGRSGSEAIERYIFATGAPTTSLSGLWYVPSEAGWGIDFDSQGSVHAAYITAYRSSGQPTWVYGVGSGSGLIRFDLLRTQGQNLCPGCTGPTSVTTTPAGTLTISTSQLGSGRLAGALDWATWPRPNLSLVRLL